MSWFSPSSAVYVPDPSAFLFQLKKDGTNSGKVFRCTESNYAIYCNSGNAACFGQGVDLHLMSGSISPSSGTYTLNGSVTFKSYDMQGVDKAGFCNDCLEVTDIEVYSVIDKADVGHLLTSPWRETVDWKMPNETIEILRAEIESYLPIHDDLSGTNARFPHCNILLMGPVGAGKSSFLNTVTSVFRGKIFAVARSGCADKSLTSKLTRYQIKSKQLLPIKLCDSRGLEMDNIMCTENMRFLLEGHLVDKFVFEPKNPINTDSPGFVRIPHLHDKIHCVAIFIDATIVRTMSEIMPEVTQNIKEMQKVMNSLDVPQVIIMTKVDRECEQCNMDVSNVYRSPVIQQRVSEVSELFGIPRNQVFPMKSYENEGKLNDSINILTMYTMKMILDQADAYLYNQCDEVIRNYTKSRKKSSSDEVPA